MAGNINTGFTTFSNVSIQGDGTNAPSAQTVALNGALLSLGTYAFSIATANAATLIPDGCLGVVFRASGLSLIYRSGSTVYSISSSAVSGTA